VRTGRIEIRVPSHTARDYFVGLCLGLTVVGCAIVVAVWLASIIP